MFIAIAGAYSERQWIKARLEAADVRQPRFRVIAEWLDSKEEDADLTDVKRTWWSGKCFTEIRFCQALVYFPSDVSGIGRHREIGFALALGRPVVLVGSRTQHPHDHATGIYQCNEQDLRRTLDGFLQAM